MQVVFYNNSSGNEHVTKSLTEVRTFDVDLKDSCSVQNPVLLLSGKYLNANYAKIPDFGNRFYYIDNIVQIRKNLWQYSLRCDVLMSFSKEIRQQTSIIDISSQSKFYNKNYESNAWATMLEGRRTNQIINFPLGFNANQAGNVLVTIGSGTLGGG